MLETYFIRPETVDRRPITAIREAQANPDPSWEPLLVTPSHPDYVAGHCITTGAAAQTLRLLFGNNGVPFSATFGRRSHLKGYDRITLKCLLESALSHKYPAKVLTLR